MKEAYPLAWPAGQPRTRPNEQKARTAWKLDVVEAQNELVKELQRIDAITILLSTNVPVGMRGQLVSGTSVRDPGVAVYFTLRGKEDFSWMEALSMSNPYPSVEEIEAAYKPLAIKWHPEAPGGDAETFKLLSQARSAARSWAQQREKREHQNVIACDKWKEVRWNINAVRLTLATLRRSEEYGASQILERLFKGFEELPEHASASATTRA